MASKFDYGKYSKFIDISLQNGLEQVKKKTYKL